MMRKDKPYYLWIDQNGVIERAYTVAELRQKCGGGRVTKMYQDRPRIELDGTIGKMREAIHTGYVVGQRWFTQFAPVEKPI